MVHRSAPKAKRRSSRGDHTTAPSSCGTLSPQAKAGEGSQVTPLHPPHPQAHNEGSENTIKHALKVFTCLFMQRSSVPICATGGLFCRYVANLFRA